MDDITQLSPLDGRYQAKVSELNDLFSEFGLIKRRLFVEIQWFKFLVKTILDFKGHRIDLSVLDKIFEKFDVKQAARIKEIEMTTNHDVKAVEYYLKEQFQRSGLTEFAEWIHFCCTSADINNIAYALMFKDGKRILLKEARKLLLRLESLAKEYKTVTMMSRTHGQPATPTTVGKEFINFAWKLRKEIRNLEDITIEAKFNGATGNFNAHYFVMPDVDWIEISCNFIKEYLQIEPIFFTTQINPNNYISEIMHSLCRLSSIVVDIDRDVWGYISCGYFKQRLKAGEVGSSTMPHKVNPIDFENSEGNLGMAIALAEHLAVKLLNSRFQRDLTDSTVLRNSGSILGFVLLGLKSTQKGLGKLDLNQGVIEKDLADNMELVAEAIQTVMRMCGEENPYEKLKDLTRGQKITQKTLVSFVKKLEKVPEDFKKRMTELTPQRYTGLAAQLVDKYFSIQ